MELELKNYLYSTNWINNIWKKEIILHLVISYPLDEYLRSGYTIFMYQIVNNKSVFYGLVLILYSEKYFLKNLFM